MTQLLVTEPLLPNLKGDVLQLPLETIQPAVLFQEGCLVLQLPLGQRRQVRGGNQTAKCPQGPSEGRRKEADWHFNRTWCAR